MLLSPQIVANALRGAAAVASANTTWNPSDKNASVTLSNGNLTATTSSSGSVRSIASHSSGKYYCENVITHSANSSFGIATSGYSLSGYIGSTANAVGCLTDGRVFLNNVNVTTLTAVANGTTWSLAIDLDNKRAWWRRNAGNWNDNVSADPATNTLGVDISGLNAGLYFVIWDGETNTDAAAMNFGATAYAQSVPSGFGNW